MPRSTQLGVTHTGGTYNPHQRSEDFLNSGADEIFALGSRTIKLWFTNPASSYPFNSKWPESFKSLVEMAEHPYYKSVFHKPFTTYILVTYSLGHADHYFTKGITDADKADEERQFYELAKHFLSAYRDTGKTFVLQHWEGDWAVRGHYDLNKDPEPAALDAMAQWLNSRQAGVERVRREVGEHGVHVYHAAEVNVVAKSMLEGKPNVVNKVLPHTHLDLASYSSWDTEGNGPQFRQAIDYIADHLPDNPIFGHKHVYIGEYGWPENDGLDKAQSTIRNVVDTATDWGCPYIVYWEVYCNEARRKPVKANDDVRGFWLIKPDGAKAWAWDYLHGKLSEASPKSATK